MRQVSLTKIFTFDCAHRLYEYDGACANIHGHTYRLEVTVGGPLAPDMIMDFFDIKKIVEATVLARIDHNYLNEIVPFNPTVENMALWIADLLENSFPEPVRLQKITLWENQSSFAEVIL